MSTTFAQYGLNWPEGTDPLQVEIGMIRKGGKWQQNGTIYGNGLPFHFERARNILWPNLDDHRWHRLCRDEILKNKVTVLMGPGSSGKTNEAAWMYLLDYWCWPEITCVLVCSTDIRGLKKRVWGEICGLWEQGVEKFDWLPGTLLDSALAITTDSMEDVEYGQRKARDMRSGIFGVPCVQSGKFVGLSKFIGIKQKRMRLIADEASLMGDTFLSAFSNLNKNEDFRAIVIGNPNDPLDPLGRAAEPRDGWTDEYMEPTKTRVWETRFMSGRCVNLIGTDSPNFDYPASEPTRYKYLISREKIIDTLSFFAKDSIEYYSQCVGSMKIGTMSRRVITRAMCQKFHALETVVWKGTARTKIAGLDAAYGGDRAVLTLIEFGEDIRGQKIISISPPVIVPILAKSELIPEDQLSTFCKDYCLRNGVAPENFWHDSTGRGTLGTSLARIWSSQCNPLEFGGTPTNRPVTSDFYIVDSVTHQRRLKMCREHYNKFVTELYFSVRYCIEGEQIRGLPEETMEEGCLRQWDKVKDKIELESKLDMKERVGRSPDLIDSLCICVEGARRRGFEIKRLGSHRDEEDTEFDWLSTWKKNAEKLVTSKMLTHR